MVAFRSLQGWHAAWNFNFRQYTFVILSHLSVGQSDGTGDSRSGRL